MKISFSLSGLSLITFIIFAILKGCGVIAWDWVFVCIPLMVIAAIVFVFLILILVMCIAYVVNERKWNK